MPDFEPNQLTVEQSEEWEELVSTGMQVRERTDKMEWVLGDLAVKASDTFGKHAVRAYAATIGVDKSRLSRYKEVAQAIDFAMREEFAVLSWSHFRACAAQLNPREWLQKAADNGWSVENLAIQINISKGKYVRPEKKVQLVECKFCHKWTIAGDKSEMCENYKDCGHIVG